MIGLPDGVRACLFNLNGVLTRTATIHVAAWKEMFDGYLSERAARTGEEFVRGTLDLFELRDGVEMLEAATNRLSTGESAFPELRNEVQAIHQVAAALLNLPQRAMAAERGQQPAEDECGGDVVTLDDYSRRRLGLRVA